MRLNLIRLVMKDLTIERIPLQPLPKITHLPRVGIQRVQPFPKEPRRAINKRLVIEQRRPGIHIRDLPFRGLVLLLARNHEQRGHPLPVRNHEQRGHPLPVHDGLSDFVVLGLLHTSDFPVLLLPPGGTRHSSNLLEKPGDPIDLLDLSRVTDADAVRSNAHEVAVPVVQRLQRELETAALDDQQTP